MDRESRIKAAKTRIKELELLINAWTPKAPEPEEPQTMQGLKISKEDLDALRKITDSELELFYNTVNLNKIK